MNCLSELSGNRKCWNCWYDEFCDWHPAGDEDACEKWKPEEGQTSEKRIVRKM